MPVPGASEPNSTAIAIIAVEFADLGKERFP
jgi:hypothetical protein